MNDDEAAVAFLANADYVAAEQSSERDASDAQERYGPSLAQWLAHCEEERKTRGHGVRSLLSDERHAFLLAHVGNPEWEARERYNARRNYAVRDGRLLHRNAKHSDGRARYQLSDSMAFQVLEEAHIRAHRDGDRRVSSAVALSDTINEKFWRVTVEQAQYWLHHCSLCQPQLAKRTVPKRARDALDDAEQRLADMRRDYDAVMNALSKTAETLGLPTRLASLFAFSGYDATMELFPADAEDDAAVVAKFDKALAHAVRWLAACRARALALREEALLVADRRKRWMYQPPNATEDAMIAVLPDVMHEALLQSEERMQVVMDGSNDGNAQPADNVFRYTVPATLWNAQLEARLVELQQKVEERRRQRPVAAVPRP